MGDFRDIFVVLFMLSTVILYFFRFVVFQMGSFSLYFKVVLLMYSFSLKFLYCVCSYLKQHLGSKILN